MRMFSRSTQRAAVARRCAVLSRPSGPRSRSEHGEHDVVADRLAQIEAEIQPVLGEIGDAGADRVLVRAQGDFVRLPTAIVPASGRVMPNSDSASSVRPAPSRPVMPSTSPA